MKSLFKSASIFLWLVPNTFSTSFLPDNKVNPNLLIITNDENEKSSLSSLSFANTDVVSLKNFNPSEKHAAYAISSSTLNCKSTGIAEFLSTMLEDSRIYVYGDTTISHYKEYFNLNKFSVQIPKYNGPKKLTSTGMLEFDTPEALSKKRQIICFSKNTRYPCVMVSGNEMDILEQQELIVQQYNETFAPMFSKSSVVQSGFQHKIIAYGPRLYLNLDYLLYKNDDETDPTYDYFALKTNATAVNNKCETTGNCDLMEIKNQLCYTSDNIIDYSPKDTKRAKSVNASLNLGSSASANIGISFETDAGPTIHTTYDSANHAVSWKVSRYWFFGSTFNNQRLSFGTSWASTGRVASINISAYARFLGNKINHIANWDTRNVTYRY